MPAFVVPRLRPRLAVLAVALALACSDSSAASSTATPFAPRSGPRGATLFTTLPADETGIVATNAYGDPRMWTEFYQELVYGALGTGVAIGDFDNDGRPDLFIVSKSDDCRLFRNLGDWRFEDVTTRSGIAAVDAPPDPDAPAVRPWRQGAAFADIDNDGDLDLFVTRFGAPNWLFINHGDGTFGEEAGTRGLGLSDASGAAAFADFDRDGWLDLYVQTNMLSATRPAGQPDRLYRNRGDGTFEDVTASAGISGDTCGHSVLWWDFDEDGWPDLHVANDYAVPNRLYRNNRDGTFTDVIDAHFPLTAYYAMGSDLCDVDNDGRLDLFVADMMPTSHERDQRGMAGSRSLNRENVEGSPNAPQYMRNTLFLARGGGHFLEAAWMAGLPASDWTWSPRFEDLDEDGLADLHVTNGMRREYHNADILQRIMASESISAQRQIMRESPPLAEANLAFRNMGDVAFENMSAAWGLDEIGVSFGAAFGDLDGDGDLDLVYGNHERGPTVLRNDNDRGHRVIIALRGARSNRFGIGATVTVETDATGKQARQVQGMRGYLSSGEPVAHFGLGDSAVIRRLTVSWPSGYSQTLENLAADHRYLIREPEGSNAADADSARDSRTRPPLFAPDGEVFPATVIVPANPTAEPNAQPLLPWSLNRRGPALASGDIDGDARTDLVISGSTRSPAHILIQQSAGHFGPAPDSALPQSASSTEVEDGPPALLDADGDGDLDLLLTRAGTRRPAGRPAYQPQLLLNDGTGAFTPADTAALPSLPISVGALAVADFDRDGRPDIFLGARVTPGRYPLPPRSALLLNRGGRFVDVTDEFSPGLRELGLVTAAIATDADRDGWPDLVVACEWGEVSLWRNRAGAALDDHTTSAGLSSAGTGLWSALAEADFNRDGRPDIVAGNLGLNTRYRATPEQPALIFFGSFSTGPASQLIEARHDGERLVPWRTRKELGARIPAILKRFPSNDAFAKADLNEILGADRVAAARRFAASELQSGVFLSRPDGSYQFNPLPRIAQVAPAQGLVAADLDGDGNDDLYVVHNSQAPDAAIGRFTGGLSQLLRGDGRGGFTPVTPAVSGLVASGAGSAALLLDLEEDGRLELIVGRYDAPLLAFRRTDSSVTSDTPSSR